MRKSYLFIFLAAFLILFCISFLTSENSIHPESNLLGTESESNRPTINPAYSVEIQKTDNQSLITNNQLSLDSVFSPDHSWVKKLPGDRIRTIIVTGDIIPARSVNSQVIRRHDFLWPYRNTADLLKSGDLTIINLESPLLENCPETNEGMVFCGDKRNIEGLIYAGVDVTTLENNHIGNHGLKGVEDTINFLSQNNIKSVTAHNPLFVPLKGKTIAVLAFNDLFNIQSDEMSDTEQSISQIIKEAKMKADIAIAAFHWGAEYTALPSQRVKNLAHLAIESGADLVIGNHPHWIQPVEIYKQKIITYAHGNFVFDQMWSEETKKGVVGKYTFLDNQIIDAEFIPVYITNYGQPSLADIQMSNNILQQMKVNSLSVQK